MCSAAAQFGVTGWVKNCRDGTVEAVVEGSEEQLASIVNWANTGPSLARVEKIEISEAAGHFEDFSVSSD